MACLELEKDIRVIAIGRRLKPLDVGTDPELD
jgi:hypothetical protein